MAVAAFEDRFPIMWALHEAGAPLTELNEYGGTVLMSAAHFGHKDDVEKLLAKGLDVNAANRRGDTPLSLACSRDDLPLVELLLARGAKMEARATRYDTPLMRASRFRRVATVKFLLERTKSEEVDAQNAQGNTALIEACKAGTKEVVELLLAAGAKAEHANKNQMTCFLEACETGTLDLIKLMLSTPGTDVHAKSRHGDGALELSRWGRDADEIQELLKARGVVAVRDDSDHEYYSHHDSRHPSENRYHHDGGMHDGAAHHDEEYNGDRDLDRDYADESHHD